MNKNMTSSGISQLDSILDGLRYGDNVVWQVDELDDYRYFAGAYANYVLQNNNNLIYLRFAPHEPIVAGHPRLIVENLDPSNGFAIFSEDVHKTIRNHHGERFFLLDNLSALVEEWGTDELLANFFQITCPFLGELGTVAYFALTRGRHANSVIARIRDTTQLLIDAYRIEDKLYIHPLKVWDRYSPQMFLPHDVTGNTWKPVFESGRAASISQHAKRQPLRTEAALIAPWDIIYNKISKYRDSYHWQQTPELQALKQEFSRMLIGRHEEFCRLADEYFELEDLLAIRDRMIGTGRIGGKTSGMLLARKIASKEAEKNNFAEILEEHDSFYIGSDVFFTFLVDNNLFRQRLSLSRHSQLNDKEFQDIEESFLKGSFSHETMTEFRNMLDYYGQAPIIVRSSSLLEDSFGNAFAGKYRSEFCVNQGAPEERLNEFLRAVKLVYASTMSPDVLSYRLKRGLVENDEQMAILVQRVSGMPYKQYFFPALAGVAFSKNPYAWSDNIDPAKGVIRLVLGLGTRAVNRVSDDYPRMIAVGKPQARPDTGERILKYSQHKIDLLDVKANALLTKSVTDIISDDYPSIGMCFSVFKDGFVFDPPYKGDIIKSGNKIALTFNKLIIKTDFVKIMDEMLTNLESAYGHPVDTEFTAYMDYKGNVRINLLQCRPLRLPGMPGDREIPREIEPKKVLFRANRVINGGYIEDIKYIVFVDPRGYGQINNLSLKKSIGRFIGLLNRHLSMRNEKFMLIGPGRWGSTNLELGINASYADINNTAVLVEVSWKESGFSPELSYGTHFFQDLVEDHIIYLPVYPDNPDSEYNNSFFTESANKLSEVIPGNEHLENIVKLIDLTESAAGQNLKVLADPESQRAVCYLE